MANDPAIYNFSFGGRAMSHPIAELNPPVRLLCGTGPTNPDPRVLRAMAAPVLGQFDPAFTAIMTEVMELGRQVFRTRNPRTFAISGTGRAGMEAGIARAPLLAFQKALAAFAERYAT